MLESQYLLKLLNFITLTSRKRRQVDRDAALERRLVLHKEGNKKEYRDLVA